jgi:hypothetical protein
MAHRVTDPGSDKDNDIVSESMHLALHYAILFKSDRVAASVPHPERMVPAFHSCFCAGGHLTEP